MPDTACGSIAPQCESLKEGVMKRHLVAGFLVMVMLLTVSINVQAQLDPKQRKAEIPFAFYVEDREFPAGTYLVGWLGGRIHIQSPDGSYSASVIAVPIELKQTRERSALQFTGYGTATYLSRVWIGGNDSGRELLRTKREVELAKKSPGKIYATVRLGPVH